MVNSVHKIIEWDQALIEKYNYSGPRYTSYPTALEFSESFTEQDFVKSIVNSENDSLSLYIHIPFCHMLCYYCGCNKIITRHQDKAERYLEYLAKEIAYQSKLFKHQVVTQIHLGGGTPTFLTKQQISWLMNVLRQSFQLASDGEYSIEIDPREIELDTLDHLRQEGFNRISLGVQDFNKDVQKAVNREQSEKFIFDMIERARSLGFVSTSIDLIYGLPHQTTESFTKTIERVIELSPDRLSVFNYAHLPQMFAAQRKLKEDDMPSPRQKLQILENTINQLVAAGYQYIGMDHFAKPDDELAVLQNNGKLHRNFQGYTTKPECDLLGLGVSAISQIGDCYAQNHKDIKEYYSSVDARSNALWKGVGLSQDDFIRRAVIKQLICHFELDFKTIESQWDLNFEDYFKEDLQLLQVFIDDKLVKYDDRSLKVTPKGELLIRNICMCFDVYLRDRARQQQFSRVI